MPTKKRTTTQTGTQTEPTTKPAPEGTDPSTHALARLGGLAYEGLTGNGMNGVIVGMTPEVCLLRINDDESEMAGKTIGVPWEDVSVTTVLPDLSQIGQKYTPRK